jgi:hypothetical protein
MNPFCVMCLTKSRFTASLREIDAVLRNCRRGQKLDRRITCFAAETQR